VLRGLQNLSQWPIITYSKVIHELSDLLKRSIINKIKYLLLLIFYYYFLIRLYFYILSKFSFYTIFQSLAVENNLLALLTTVVDLEKRLSPGDSACCLRPRHPVVPGQTSGA